MMKVSPVRPSAAAGAGGGSEPESRSRQLWKKWAQRHDLPGSVIEEPALSLDEQEYRQW